MPKKQPKDERHNLSVPLTEKERSLIDNVASQLGLNTSTYVRQVIRRLVGMPSAIDQSEQPG